MPGYEQPWNVTDPPGGELARNIDDAIRKLRKSLDERFKDILKGNGLFEDPIALKDSLAGIIPGKVMILSSFHFADDTSSKGMLRNRNYLLAYTDSAEARCPLPVPQGCIIKKVELMVSRGDATSIDFKVFKFNFGAVDSTAEVAAVNSAAAGIQVMTTGDVNFAVDGSGEYFVGVEGNGAAGNGFFIYGVRVTYDRQGH